jgi:hypothetical protein
LIEELEISLHDFICLCKTFQWINLIIDMQKVEHQRNHPACVIDTERIFGYRALRISRNDQTPLPGFDENYYVNNTEATARSIQDLLAEFSAVSFEFAFKSFSEDQKRMELPQMWVFQFEQ